MEMLMRISLQLACLAGYISKNGTVPHELIRSIKNAAVTIWEQSPKDKAIRFIHKMPSSNGQYFRFFNVSQKNENELVISL